MRYYALRWLVERYHFVMKSGCRVERLQLETAGRLDRAVATYSAVAWRLLWLTYEARRHPGGSSERVLPREEWEVLCRAHRGGGGCPPTLRDAVRRIARLGGFLGRKGDGEPGVKTLWRGLRRLKTWSPAISSKKFIYHVDARVKNRGGSRGCLSELRGSSVSATWRRVRAGSRPA